MKILSNSLNKNAIKTWMPKVEGDLYEFVVILNNPIGAAILLSIGIVTFMRLLKPTNVLEKSTQLCYIIESLSVNMM